MKAIVIHSVVPVRSRPNEGAEQQTQLLFAQTVEVIEQTEKWLLVRNEDDGQQGWVDRKMLTPISDEEYQNYQQTNRKAMVLRPMIYAVSKANGQLFPLTAGTRLPDYKDGVFSIMGSQLVVDAETVISDSMQLNKENLMQTIQYFLNIPYLWGGKNCMGMDCSGFTQIVMSLFGIDLPRNASQQALKGEVVGFLQEAQAGDLVFFDHHSVDAAATNISHVGILIDSETVVHCSGRVKVERIDNNGIISSFDGKYTHDLRLIKRYV